MASEPEIFGDPSRQATDSLRGYLYQIYASALAWLNLRDSEILHLEVAEDFALSFDDKLDAVQVKDTKKSGNITTTSPVVADVLNAYVKLLSRNPGKDVQLRFWSTSAIALERRTRDRVAGKAGLEYWRDAARSAEVAPLRKRILELSINDATTEFINGCDDKDLREKLLRKIHWDCGQPDLIDLRQ